MNDRSKQISDRKHGTFLRGAGFTEGNKGTQSRPEPNITINVDVSWCKLWTSPNLQFLHVVYKSNNTDK